MPGQTCSMEELVKVTENDQKYLKHNKHIINQ